MKNKQQNKNQNVHTTSQDLPIWLVISFFALTVIIFFGGNIFGNYFLWDDFREYFFPTQSFAASEFAQGRIPFWNPYNLGGMPFLADIQVGFFYPFNRLLGITLDDNGMISPWFYQIIIFLHFFLMQINFYVLARYLKISSYGSIIGAIAFSFSFPILLHTIHPAIVFHWAWFPLIFYFLKKSLDESQIKYAAISGLILGITTLSGHPQISFYFFFILLLFVVWNVVSKLIFEKEHLVGSLYGFLTIVIGVLIFAIQFLPSNELAKHTIRSEMNYEKSSENSLKYEQIFTLFSPKLFGYYDADNKTEFPPILQDEYDGKQQPVKNYHYWETAIFFGSVALLLAVIGIWVTPKNNFLWFLLVLILFGFFYALGKNFILHPLMHNLPFFDIFRNPVRMFVFSIFAMSIFAGFAFDKIFIYFDKSLSKKILVILGVILLLSVMNVVGLSQMFAGIAGENLSKSISNSIFSFLMLLLVSILIIFASKYPISRLVGFVIVVIALFLELYIQGRGFFNSEIDPAKYYQIPEQTVQAFRPANPQSDQFRVKTRTYSPSFMAMNRNQGMISRIYQLEGYNPLVLKYASLPFPWETVYSLMNIKYDIVFNPQTGQPEFTEITNRNGNFWFVQNALFVDFNNAKNFFEKNSIDFRKEVVIHTKDFDLTKFVRKISDTTISTKATLKLTNYEPNNIALEAMVENDGILVFSELYYPDWKAYVDGKETKVVQANYSLRAIELPKGNHRIEMKYESSSFRTGAILSLVGIVISLVLIFFDKNKKQ